MSFSSIVTSTIMNLLEPQQMLILSEGLNVFRVAAPERLTNRKLRSLRIREDTGCSVVAVKRKEELLINPEPDLTLEASDELVLIGTARSENAFMKKYPASE